MCSPQFYYGLFFKYILSKYFNIFCLFDAVWPVLHSVTFAIEFVSQKYTDISYIFEIPIVVRIKLPSFMNTVLPTPPIPMAHVERTRSKPCRMEQVLCNLCPSHNTRGCILLDPLVTINQNVTCVIFPDHFIYLVTVKMS